MRSTFRMFARASRASTRGRKCRFATECVANLHFLPRHFSGTHSATTTTFQPSFFAIFVTTTTNHDLCIHPHPLLPFTSSQISINIEVFGMQVWRLWTSFVNDWVCEKIGCLCKIDEVNSKEKFLRACCLSSSYHNLFTTHCCYNYNDTQTHFPCTSTASALIPPYSVLCFYGR